MVEIERLVSGDLNKSIEQCVTLLMDVERKVHVLKNELAQTLNQLPPPQRAQLGFFGMPTLGLPQANLAPWPIQAPVTAPTEAIPRATGVPSFQGAYAGTPWVNPAFATYGNWPVGLGTVGSWPVNLGHAPFAQVTPLTGSLPGVPSVLPGYAMPFNVPFQGIPFQGVPLQGVPFQGVPLQGLHANVPYAGIPQVPTLGGLHQPIGGIHQPITGLHQGIGPVSPVTGYGYIW